MNKLSIMYFLSIKESIVIINWNVRGKSLSTYSAESPIDYATHMLKDRARLPSAA